MHTLKTKVNYHFDSDYPNKKSEYELLFHEQESAKFTRNDIPRIENRRYKSIVPYRVRYLCSLKSSGDNIINIYAMDVDLDEYIEENDPKKLVYVVSINAGNCYLSVRVDNTPLSQPIFNTLKRYLSQSSHPVDKTGQGFINSIHFEDSSFTLFDCVNCYLFPVEEHDAKSFSAFMMHEHLAEMVTQSKMMRY